MNYVNQWSNNLALGAEIDAPLPKWVEDYLCDVMTSFHTNSEPSMGDSSDTSEAVFRTLIGHRYNYLSRGRSMEYRDRVMPWINEAVQANEPVRFYYDLGGGYRASLRPGKQPVTFSVGLGEFLALRQIALFCNELRGCYPPQAHFWIVIDNLCAYFTNDIPIEETRGYAKELRRLIAELGLNEYVEVLLESELFSVEEFRHEFMTAYTRPKPSRLTPAEYENVTRFLGRLCEQKEAEARVSRYERASTATECLIAPVIRGVRLTQRATAGTLCFRSFRGGDQRIQSGDLALSYGPDRSLSPVLLTSRNVDRYRCLRVPAPDCIPQSVPTITIARPLAG